MLFSRSVARRDAILNGFGCAVLAIASIVINLIVAIQNKSSTGVLENLILSLVILFAGLWIAIAYLKNNKVSAYICALIVMPIYGTAVFFGNIAVFTSGVLQDHFWPVGLGYLWYFIGAITVVEAAAYEVVSLVKGKENPKFSPSANAESAAFLLAGAAVCFAIAGAKYTLDFWGLFLGVLSEIAFVEASAEALYLYREVETK